MPGTAVDGAALQCQCAVGVWAPPLAAAHWPLGTTPFTLSLQISSFLSLPCSCFPLPVAPALGRPSFFASFPPPVSDLQPALYPLPACTLTTTALYHTRPPLYFVPLHTLVSPVWSPWTNSSAVSSDSSLVVTIHSSSFTLSSPSTSTPASAVYWPPPGSAYPRLLRHSFRANTRHLSSAVFDNDIPILQGLLFAPSAHLALRAFYTV
ncbi:hypothetical protein HRR90_007539 [Exophiala dermatitidis]|nr:hypothetical protein HRR73_008802 [Exophiala dermatitidis]KAJ4504627.1 hypothetical protein HRR74_008893 [Exophiala dermatitidis]KAJ4540399.1 hypothetical protein HRR76_003799 [Exophiala dermatitidis]KAJ4564316.1 hypothetical protein HRR81_008259 [Exophiala dermatitidis]KAJ4589267.1 hypothetical protein HRR84_007974 [Exophiala dermatitidis]